MNTSLKETVVNCFYEFAPIYAGIALGALAVGAMALTPQFKESQKAVNFEKELKRQGLQGFRLVAPATMQNIAVAGREKDGTFTWYAVNLAGQEGPFVCVTKGLLYQAYPSKCSPTPYAALPELDRERMNKVIGAVRSSRVLLSSPQKG